MENIIKQHQEVKSYNNYIKEDRGIDRLYLNLSGTRSNFRGDKTTKVYWDRKLQKLVVERHKGMTSSDFEESLAALQEAIA